MFHKLNIVYLNRKGIKMNKLYINLLKLGAVVFMVSSYAAPVLVSNVAATGQTLTAPTVALPTPASTMYDGALHKGVSVQSPRFVVGTATESNCITDKLTGLVWYKNIGVDAESRTWSQAKALVATNNAKPKSEAWCGHTDWRMPNINELKSLSNYGVSNQDTNLVSKGFVDNIITNSTGVIWSSTPYKNDSTQAWGLYLRGWGEVTTVSQVPPGPQTYLMPVRSGK
jgi:hypothetical protein